MSFKDFDSHDNSLNCLMFSPVVLKHSLSDIFDDLANLSNMLLDIECLKLLNNMDVYLLLRVINF